MPYGITWSYLPPGRGGEGGDKLQFLANLEICEGLLCQTLYQGGPNFADRAIYFACVNFYLFLFIFKNFLETNYLRIHQTNFDDFFFTR